MIDVFAIGVRLSMSSNAPQMLTTILRQLGMVDASVASVNRNLRLASGALALMGGVAALKGMWSIVEAGRALNLQLERTRQLGGDFAKNLPQTRANAFEIARAAPGTVSSDAVRIQREMELTTGRSVEPVVVAEAAKAAMVVSHATGENVDEMTRNLIKLVDQRGQIYSKDAAGVERVDAAKLMAELNAAAKGLVMAQGFMSSTELLTMIRQGGLGVKNMAPEAAYSAMVTAGVAMGAAKAGTADTALVSQLVGGHMTKQVAQNMQDAGLLAPADWQSGKSGGVTMTPAGSRKFETVLQDPIAWLTTGTGHAAIVAAAAKDSISITTEVLRLFGRQTAQRFASEAMSNEPQFVRQRQMYGEQPKIGKQFDELMAHDFQMNVNAVSAAWKTLMEALSDAGVPSAISIMHGLTTAIQYMTQLVREHPDAAGRLMELAAGIAAVTALSGGILIFTTALGPFTTGIKLLIGAFAGAVDAAAVATKLATGIGIVSGSLSAAAGVIGLAVVAAKLGSDAETPANREHLEQLRRERGHGLSPSTLPTQDGFGPDGTPIHRESYRPGPGGEGPPALSAASWRAPPVGELRAVMPHAAPPVADRPPVVHAAVTTHFNIDGRQFASLVTRHQVAGMQRPQTGATGPDQRGSVAGAFAGAFG